MTTELSSFLHFIGIPEGFTGNLVQVN